MKREQYDETMTSRVSLHPFLAGMNKAQLAFLIDCAVSIRFEAGDVILKEGGPAKRLFLIETGKVVLESTAESGRPVVIDSVGPGGLLGWSWMYAPYTWQFTARAVTRTRAIFFEGSVLREYCERNHSLGFELLKRITAVMTGRLQKARQTMLDLHLGKLHLPPVILESPFMDQELDLPENLDREYLREGTD